MINYALHTRLKGAIVLTDAFHADPALGRDRSLYKFIWVRSGTLRLEIDHVETTLEAGEVVPLTPLHRIAVREVAGDYLTLLFNSNFYCIYGHDDEVSCNGLLFNGGPETVRLRPDAARTAALYEIADKLAGEYAIEDSLREEMLRILLKRFIITCTRLARERFAVAPGKEKAFDIVRQYYVLVDEHFREKKQVQEYAENAVQPLRRLRTPLATAGDPRTDRCRSPTAAAPHLQKCKGDRRVARIRGYRRIQPFFQKNSGRKHHRLPQEEQTCGTHIPSPIRTRRGKTGLRQTGKANGSFPANGNNRQLFRQNRH